MGGDLLENTVIPPSGPADLIVATLYWTMTDGPVVEKVVRIDACELVDLRFYLRNKGDPVDMYGVLFEMYRRGRDILACLLGDLP